MPEGDVAVIELKASLNAVDSADFGSDAKAGVAVVRVGGVCRYAFKTADGVVVDGTKVAPASSESSVRITADFGKSKVVYDVDGAEFGPFALNSSVKRLSSVAFKGLNFVEEMKGDYESVAADTYLAEVGGVKFTSLASALASKAAGVVKLLWDASWNPTAISAPSPARGALPVSATRRERRTGRSCLHALPRWQTSCVPPA